MTFLMNGTLYQGSKPVMWSPVEKTALAEAEVEYHDAPEPHDLGEVPGRPARAVPRADRRDRRRRAQPPIAVADAAARRRSVVIWTTTPWTIPQNRAICFSPEIAYGALRA